MPPNITDPPMDRDPESFYNPAELSKEVPKAPVAPSENNYTLNIVQSVLNQIAHLFIGVTVGAALLFALRNGLPIGATPQHIIMCVLGYQLLMAQAILAMTSHNGWSSRLRLVDKKRAHWILQILGSGLALAGCFWKILDKNVHWNSLHGQFGLVSMVFTSVSLVNGLTSLYAYELSKFRLPPSLSKLTHICFGVVGFAAASICLCYGMDKSFFRSWATNEFTTALIIMTGTFTAIVIFNPLITFYVKGKQAFKRS